MEIKVSDHEVIRTDADFEDPALPHRHCFSPSQYKTYKRCPKQYYWRYIRGRKSPPGVALIQGTAVHKGAEETHKHTIETGVTMPYEEASSAVADSFESRKGDVEDWGEVDQGAAKDKVLGSFAVYYNVAVPLINPVRVESGFAVKIGTVPVIGFIDLIDKVPTGTEDENGEAEAIEVVSDLKFTGRKWSDIQVRHDPQLTFYAHVEGTPRVRFDFLVATKSKTRYIAEKSLRNPHDIKGLIEDLEETVDYIKKGVFPRVLQTEWCCTQKWCGFFDECRGPK